MLYDSNFIECISIAGVFCFGVLLTSVKIFVSSNASINFLEAIKILDLSSNRIGDVMGEIKTNTYYLSSLSRNVLSVHTALCGLAVEIIWSESFFFNK